MARIFYAGAVDEIKGSIGGTTFQQNHSGTIVRSKPIRIGKFTSFQQTYTQRFGAGAILWNALSSSNKALWNAFAVAHNHTNYWGETKVATGMNWFLHCYMNRIMLQQAAPVAPPAFTLQGQFPTITLTLTSSVFSATWTDGGGGSEGYAFWFFSAPTGSSQFRNRSLLKRPLNMALNYAPPLPLTTYYKTRFGITNLPLCPSGQSYIHIGVVSVHPTTFLASPMTHAYIPVPSS